MALKKSQLYSSLWQSCDELRGQMDASQYKDYILTLLFMKYVSDKSTGKSGSVLIVPKGGSFADIVAAKNAKDIGEKIDVIISTLAKKNGLEGVIDQAQFNDEAKLGVGKEMQDRLSKLVAIFDDLDFRANRAEGDDLLGDAYEYLMRNFATQSGKSKGQFYTPAEVSRVMAQVIDLDSAANIREPTVYDPTCGSGSLLIKVADVAAHPRLGIYGQEMDLATWALARMNLFLHGYPTHELWRGNTLAAPYFKDRDNRVKRFDFAVANPPFSAKAWSSGLRPADDEFKRFEFGIPPEKNGDYAFLLHLIASLKPTGKGAIILPHGVLFRGFKEGDIRRNLIQHGLIKGIIGLPPNLFYGTSIPACIIVIDKENAHSRTGIFMIDASKGFIKDGNKNRLRAQDIHKIVDVFNRQLVVDRYSRMVPLAEISNPTNDYNLNLQRYVDSSEPEDLHDLDAHLNGGIPNSDIDTLSAYWNVFPSLRKALFTKGDRPRYSEARVEASQVKTTILESPEFGDFTARVSAIIDTWRKANTPSLNGLKIDSRPRDIIDAFSENLLTRFSNLPLLNKYDVYQHLMDYWEEVMQDDVYLIAADGWLEAARPRELIEKKEAKIKEAPDLSIGRNKYKMDLLPPALIVARYFAKQRAAIDVLQAGYDSATSQLEEYVEEHSGEDGLLAEAENEKGRITETSVKERLKAIKSDPQSQDERDALAHCLGLFEAESEARHALKVAQDRLNKDVLAKYSRLKESEIKTLVIDDKWFTSIAAAIESELRQLTQQLAGRVGELEERYASSAKVLERELDQLTSKVAKHLKKMGFSAA